MQTIFKCVFFVISKLCLTIPVVCVELKTSNLAVSHKIILIPIHLWIIQHPRSTLFSNNLPVKSFTHSVHKGKEKRYSFSPAKLLICKYFIYAGGVLVKQHTPQQHVLVLSWTPLQVFAYMMQQGLG